MNKKQYILGAITITLIIGGTAYAIKRSYDKKKQEEEGMTVDEARALVKLKEYNPEAEDILNEKVPLSNPKVISVIPQNFEELEEIGEEFSEEGNGFYDDVDFNTPLSEYMNEEDKKLKHDPNSVEANQQYIKMELAEWVPMEDTYQTMLKLFDFPFEPQNDGDHIMMTKIIDHKAQFFGLASRWTKKVTFADVVLHFGRLSDFHVGEGVRYWVDYILEFNDLHHTTTSLETGELIERLNSHSYFNPRTNTYGLFGLSQYHYEQALSIAHGTFEQKVTYEIEFEELLKSVIS